MAKDPVETNPDNYRVVFENERVRVLEYMDFPGNVTTEHSHPDSVMITASDFRRRISTQGRSIEVELPSGAVRWLPAQDHVGSNIGETNTHTFFVELKESAPASPPGSRGPLGPSAV
ncbi:cytoplasmic protein [Arthrobacter sp. CAN_A1]|uniref:cytoplasmic protein n=1 Tax=Arthrobacter sp. CAN_A1 TaxID=2787717 RepID=UPI0018CB6B46